MKKQLLYRTIVLIMLLFMGGLFTFTSRAQADDGVSTSMFVSPMSQEILLVPGEKYEGVISVSNTSRAHDNLVYTAEVGSYNRLKDEDMSDDYGGVNTEERTKYNVMMDWITLSKNGGTVEPNGRDEVIFTIDVPEDAPAGAQYASILISGVNDNNDHLEDAKGNNALIQSRAQMVSAVIANVAGETIEKGTIVDNSIPSFLLASPLQTTSMVKNEGNVYANAEYILQVWPLFSDEEICTNEEEPETSLVLPETERYHSQSCALPSVGIFRAKQTVKIFGEESIVEKTIIVCPIWLLFIIFFAIAAIIIWLIMKARSRKSTNSRKTSAE